MSENLFLGIIAATVAVILLGMPFWLFGKKKETVLVPDPVPGEEDQPVTARELKVVRKMLLDLLSVDIVDEGSCDCIKSFIDTWKPGTTYACMMQEFFDMVECSDAHDLPKLKSLAAQQKEALETIAKMKGLDPLVAENTRICRICNRCLTDILEAEEI